MKPLSLDSIGPIDTKTPQPEINTPPPRWSTLQYGLAGVVLLFIWFFVYNSLHDIAGKISFDLLGLILGTGEAVAFFLYDTPKVFMLLFLVVFAMGFVRTFFTAQRTQKILAGKNVFTGHFLAALLEVVTPFCSCSAVPLFIGFVGAGVLRDDFFLSHCRPHGQ